MMEQGPDERRITEASVDFESGPTADQIDELSPEQIEALEERRELERVLAEDTPQTEEAPESVVSEEAIRALYEELKNGLDSNGDIELLSSDEAPEEVFTDKFIEQAQQEINRVLSSDDTGENNNESTA